MNWCFQNLGMKQTFPLHRLLPQTFHYSDRKLANTKVQEQNEQRGVNQVLVMCKAQPLAELSLKKEGEGEGKASV